MRSSMVMMALAAIVVAGCGGVEAGAESGDEAAVDTAVVEEAEARVASLFEAMNAADPQAVIDHYAQEMSRVSCTQMHDRAFFGQTVQSYYRARDSLRFEYEFTASTALGPDAAVVSARGSLPDAQGLFWTWVLERGEGGELQVVHEHESWPDCPPARTTFHRQGGMMGTPDTSGADTMDEEGSS